MVQDLPGQRSSTVEGAMVFKALGWGALIIFLIGLAVVIGIFSLIF